MYENANFRMKSVTIKQMVSRGMWGLVIVLVGYGSNSNRLKIYEKVYWMVSHSDFKHLLQGALLAIHQFSEPAVTVTAVVPVHTSEKQKEIKTVLVLARLPHSVVPWCSLNCLNGWNKEKAFGRDCRDCCISKNRELKNHWFIEWESVGGSYKDGFVNK